MGPDKSRTNSARRAATRAQGFTLIDVLVSVAVISILIGILLPSVSMVRESARKVICASNLRQAGIGTSMFADQNNDRLPPSVFLPALPSSRATTVGSPHLMDTVRTDGEQYQSRDWGQWDGLGLLFEGNYLAASEVFYCPSHRGTQGFERYADRWATDEATEIISNYQYRGSGPNGARRLYAIDPGAALVTDSLRSFEDLNHETGFNLLKAGLAVSWFRDEGGQVMDIVARGDGGDEDESATLVTTAWEQFDGGPAPARD